MGLDVANNRRAATWMLPIPDGTIDVYDRRQATLVYPFSPTPVGHGGGPDRGGGEKRKHRKLRAPKKVFLGRHKPKELPRKPTEQDVEKLGIDFKKPSAWEEVLHLTDEILSEPELQGHREQLQETVVLVGKARSLEDSMRADEADARATRLRDLVMQALLTRYQQEVDEAMLDEELTVLMMLAD